MNESDNAAGFLRDLIHELKDPFAAVYGGLELVGHAPPLAARERERLEASMLRNSQVMKRVLEDASVYLRLLNHPQAPTGKPAELRSLLAQAVEDVKPQFETRSQTVQALCPELWMLTEGDSLRRCLACLLGSLSRVCSQGEMVEIRGEVHGEKLRLRLDVPGRPSRELGHGVDFREQLAVRLAASLDGQAYRLALDAWSLEVPYLATDPAPLADQKEIALPARLPKILVVDDNVDGADTLSLWLEAQGYEVATAYDGERGLAEYLRYGPDIGLFDVGLPRKDGYQLAREVRAEGFRGTLIAITGYGQEKDRSEALGAGFDHHLVKPVDLAILAELLRSLGAATNEASASPPSVLVVEDNPLALQVVVMMLRNLGARVTSSRSAEQGLEEISKEAPDLVLCDLGLPGELDGFDLARWVRQRPETREIPLLALTGDAASADLRALEAGFNEVLEKPVDEATLRRVLGLCS